MARRKRPLPLLENIEIQNTAAEGKCIVRFDEKVLFVPYTAPGDIVDIQVTKKKRSFLEGRVVNYHKKSERRVEPKCSHFGLCGGCKWQHLDYKDQLSMKQQQVIDNFQRIGKVEIKEINPIIGCENQYFYRNKLEFTFSNRKWLTDLDAKPEDGGAENTNGLGFHIPGRFDKILDIETCYLQKDPSNDIRNFIRTYANENNLEFYNNREHTGLLRNIIIRTSSTKDLMLIVILSREDEHTTKLLKALADKFPDITSLMYVVNDKLNDTIWDLEVKLFKGEPFLMEEMKKPDSETDYFKFKVRPKSFYQTNPQQAYKLYKTAFDFAQFNGGELVYDLYTGAGTIATFISNSVKEVIGIESVEQAIIDARENSKLNGINNTKFFVGDMMKILSPEFIAKNGKPDIIITDPPRAGMHPKVVDQIIQAAPSKIVYVSCNPATQARDIQLLSEKYDVARIQPVDMFPQTHHVENVALLILR